jgi:signal transduction histidine kinase
MKLTRSLIADVTLALGLGVVAALWTTHADFVGPADQPLDVLSYVLIAVAALALVVRRVSPLVALAVAAACSSTYLVIGYPYGPILVAQMIAVYTVARYRPLSLSVPASLAALLAMLAHIITNSAALPGLLGVIPGSAWVVVPFALGVTVRLVREQAAQARAEAVRQRVDDERLRMAQEVHDIVGHGLAAIKMQADVALHLMARRPEQAETALNAISRTSTEALEELRATLGVVRRIDLADARSPAPGLDRLEELRQRMDDAGVAVEVETTGAPRSLPLPVDLAAYRVLQESLTNVLRHAAAKVATVRIGYETGKVTLTISNPAPPARGRYDGGLGIPGMRERVEALGGQFAAGPAPEGRFEVRATLPTGEPA